MINKSLLLIATGLGWLELALPGKRHLLVLTAWGNDVSTKTTLIIAELDVELSAIGGYDSISGMPCGCLHGPIRPWIRPENASDVPSLVSATDRE